MSGFLNFCSNYFVIFLILGLILGFGISGFYVDKNTNILDTEKKKKALLEKSMNIETLKSQFKDKSLSLGGTMGVKSGNDNQIQKTQNGRIFGKTVPSAWTLLNQHYTSSLPLSLRIAYMKKNFTSFDFFFKISFAKTQNDFLLYKHLLKFRI